MMLSRNNGVVWAVPWWLAPFLLPVWVLDRLLYVTVVLPFKGLAWILRGGRR